MTNKTEKLAVLASIAGNTAFGFSFMFSRLALDAASPLVLLCVRFVTAFLILNLMLLFKKARLDLKGKRLVPLLLIGLAQPVCYFIFENYGILMTSSSFAGEMIALIPVVALLFGAIFLKEKPSRFQTVCAVLSVAGVLIATMGGGGEGFSVSALGSVLLIGAVLSSVVFNLLSRKVSGSFSPFERTYAMFALGSGFFTALALFECRRDLSGLLLRPLMNPVFLVAILYLAGLSSVAAFLMINYSITHISVARVTAFANLSTVISIFAGVLFLSEPFGARQLLGSLMIILGVCGVNRVGVTMTAEESNSRTEEKETP